MTYTSHIAKWDDYVESCSNDGSGFQRVFLNLVQSDAQALEITELLDVGCGSAIPNPLRPLRARIQGWDGVEPSPAISEHSELRNRWQGTLEEAPIGDEAYRFALAYNVVEHVPSPKAFLEKLHRVLEPNGVFWGLTPHANHPFARLSRGIELIGLKQFMAWTIARRAGKDVVNDYPAYYRLNSPKSIDSMAKSVGFREATYYFFPSPQWAAYFPGWLQMLPSTYDVWLGNRYPKRALLMAMRLVK